MFNIDRSGEEIKFKFRSDSLRTFIAFTHDKAMSPVIKPSALPNQDLHSSAPADMIIIITPTVPGICRKTFRHPFSKNRPYFAGCDTGTDL